MLFAYMARGHLIPFLALAKLIEKKNNYVVTIANTLLNIKNIRSSLAPEIDICLKKIPFGATNHVLPSDTENTSSLAYSDVI